MPDISSRAFSDKLRSLTTELRALDRDLKSNPPLNGTALREFRQALDNVRMTAWTVNELLDARQTQRNPLAVLSFLTAERLRRFSQMVRDLCGDLEHDGATWPVQGITAMEDSLKRLREGLRNLAAQRDQTVSRNPRDE